MMMIPLPVRFEEHALLWTVDEVYTLAECAAMIARIEQNIPTAASANRGYRDQDRVMIDDTVAADDLQRRLEGHLPETLGQFRLLRLNERFRYYRYNTGQQFSPHMDHWYRPNQTEITLLTILIYFNADFEGGHTTFTEQLDADIVPKPGRAAIFQHKVRHEGCPVISGTKYAMRTEAIYKADGPIGYCTL